MRVLLARLAIPLLRLYTRTFRVMVRCAAGDSRPADESRFGNELYAVRERDLVALACMARFARFHTLVARGRDGDWAAAVARGLGCAVIRGSSRHDPAAAAKALVDALRGSAAPAMLVVDGPVGPSGVAKEGIGAIARLTGRPIVIASADASPRIVLRGTWSRMRIPLPFARVDVALSAPLAVPHDANRETIREAAAHVTAGFAAEVA